MFQMFNVKIIANVVKKERSERKEREEHIDRCNDWKFYITFLATI